MAPGKLHKPPMQRTQSCSRLGAATVELAVCLPLIMAFVFGAIEASNAVYLEQALTVAAFEAGKVASAIGGDSDTAAVQANAVLSTFRVQSATVTITPSITAETPIGTTIVVTCSAPLGSNTVTTWCIGNITQTASFTIPRL